MAEGLASAMGTVTLPLPSSGNGSRRPPKLLGSRPAGRHRRGGGPPAGALRGLAGPRRPGGRWVGAARPPDRLAVGRGRHRRHLPDQRRAGTGRGGARGTATRSPGAPAATPCSPPPPGPGCGAAAPPGGGTGRDLERHAVLLPALVPRAPHRLPPPRPRRDVADGPAAPAGPDRRGGRSPGGPSPLPQQPHRHPLPVVERGDRRRCSVWPRTGCRWPRPGWSPGSRPAAADRPPRWWWRWGGWCRSSASTCSSSRWSGSRRRSPTCGR